MQTAQDNIDLQTTILSRFDLIFIVKDVRMYSQDKVVNNLKIGFWKVQIYVNIEQHLVLLMQIIASHIISLHASANAATDVRDTKEDNWLKRSKLWKILIVYIDIRLFYGEGLNRSFFFAGIFSIVGPWVNLDYPILQPHCCRRVMLELDRYGHCYGVYNIFHPNPV